MPLTDAASLPSRLVLLLDGVSYQDVQTCRSTQFVVSEAADRRPRAFRHGFRKPSDFNVSFD